MRFGGASPGGRGFRSSTQGEDLTRPILESGVLRQLVALLKPYKYQVAGLSALISASAALGTVAPQFVRIAFDEVIPRGEVRPFLYLALAFVVFYLLRALVQYAGMYLSYAFTQEIISDIRIRAYERLLHLPIVRFTEERSGSLTSRVVNDVNALEGMIQAGATRLAGQLFSILVIGAILIWMDWRLAAINLVAVPLLAGITRHYQIPLRHASRAIRKRVGEMTAIASESISNIQVVKSFASERIERDRFGGENDEYVTLNLDRRKDVGKMEAYITLTAEYAVGTLLLVGGWLVVGGDITLGELTAFVMYQRQLQSPVMSVMFFNNQLQAGMAALERVSDLLDSEPEKGGPVDEMVSGQVELRDVHFTFPGAERPALGGVSFRIPAGTTAALVGPSGAGKTTVTKLLGRLYDADAGSVLVGGLDVEEYDLETLRSGIALVPQEPTLFSGSVRENIRYADPEASDEAIVRAARLANAEEFITLLPQGYDTEIGERGVKLSGGQKQRIAIARAILKEAKILVLDEATSALDSESEAVIQDALEGLFADRSGVTSIVIAHRLSTIDGADNILVLDDGKLVEQGTHGELMVQGGLYASLRERQFRDQAAEEFLELQPSLE
jgi:ABC-type multidrug transport system fused ATPase/permease subunit